MDNELDHYDVIVVGARAAGAGTALVLARAGHRVLVLDRARRGSDTLSTHALMRPAVMQLDRWGLLDEVVAAGTPGQDQVVFHYGDRPVPVATSSTLYAPRRTVLDPLLAEAAERSGAEVRFGVDVEGLVRDPDGRVTGVRVRADEGVRVLHAGWVVGADGRRSRVAAQVAPAVTHRATATSAFVYGYVAGLEPAGYEWCYRPGTTAGVIPTNDGLSCVFVGVPPEQLTPDLRTRERFLQVLAQTTPAVAQRVADGRLVGPLRGFPGMIGWLRRPWGPGWALVGDAGYFKDPTTAHGITDALRDAQLLGDALGEILTGGARPATALGRYERVRDRLSLPFFDLTNRIAGFGWSLPEVQRLHLQMSDVMKDEVAVMASEDATAGSPLVA